MVCGLCSALDARHDLGLRHGKHHGGTRHPDRAALNAHAAAAAAEGGVGQEPGAHDGVTLKHDPLDLAHHVPRPIDRLEAVVDRAVAIGHADGRVAVAGHERPVASAVPVGAVPGESAVHAIRAVAAVGPVSTVGPVSAIGAVSTVSTVAAAPAVGPAQGSAHTVHGTAHSAAKRSADGPAQTVTQPGCPGWCRARRSVSIDRVPDSTDGTTDGTNGVAHHVVPDCAADAAHKSTKTT